MARFKGATPTRINILPRRAVFEIGQKVSLESENVLGRVTHRPNDRRHESQIGNR